MNQSVDPVESLNHFDQDGRVHMVDVSSKTPSHREAIARGIMDMDAHTRTQIEARGFKKGDVLSVAELAGVMGAKHTANLIPLCHPLSLTHVSVKTAWMSDSPSSRAYLGIEATVRTFGSTGVEMEALTACTTALLTVYDMCKAVDRSMTMRQVGLIRKSGGKHGTWTNDAISPMNGEGPAI